MAERRNQRDVCLEYTFDRLLVAKLEQVYRTLVPDRLRAVSYTHLTLPTNREV